jgi:hypothetical protein
LNCGAAIAARRAHARLRYALALTYCVMNDYEPLDGRTAHVWLQAECREEDAGRVRDELLAQLEAIAHEGPTPAELDERRTGWLNQLDDAAAVGARLQGHLFDELCGVGWGGDRDLRDRVAGVTPADCGAALRSARGSLMVLPIGARRARRVPGLRRPSDCRGHRDESSAQESAAIS